MTLQVHAPNEVHNMDLTSVETVFPHEASMYGRAGEVGAICENKIMMKTKIKNGRGGSFRTIAKYATSDVRNNRMHGEPFGPSS